MLNTIDKTEALNIARVKGLLMPIITAKDPKPEKLALLASYLAFMPADKRASLSSIITSDVINHLAVLSYDNKLKAEIIVGSIAGMPALSNWSKLNNTVVDYLINLLSPDIFYKLAHQTQEYLIIALVNVGHCPQWKQRLFEGGVIKQLTAIGLSHVPCNIHRSIAYAMAMFIDPLFFYTNKKLIALAEKVVSANEYLLKMLGYHDQLTVRYVLLALEKQSLSELYAKDIIGRLNAVFTPLLNIIEHSKDEKCRHDAFLVLYNLIIPKKRCKSLLSEEVINVVMGLEDASDEDMKSRAGIILDKLNDRRDPRRDTAILFAQELDQLTAMPLAHPFDLS